jgi:hypothetical protein
MAPVSPHDVETLLLLDLPSSRKERSVFMQKLYNKQAAAEHSSLQLHSSAAGVHLCDNAVALRHAQSRVLLLVEQQQGAIDSIQPDLEQLPHFVELLLGLVCDPGGILNGDLSV